MPDLLLDVDKQLTRIGLIPAPVQLFGDKTELDDKISREILRLHLAALLPPEPDKRGLVTAHNDPRLGAPDEMQAILRVPCPHVCSHGFLTCWKWRLISD